MPDAQAGLSSRIATAKEARRTLNLNVLALVAAALFQTAALSLASSAWSLLPVAMGVAAIVLRLVPRPIVAAAALILAVAVVVLQLGLVVAAARPGYGTLAVGGRGVGGDPGVAGPGGAAAMAGE
jgi:hypothetical protein